MLFNTFWDLIAEVKKYPKTKLCVAAAADENVLLAVKDALGTGIVDPFLVGDMERIWNISVKISLDLRGIKIINESNPLEASRQAVRLVGGGGADVLMKGMINSSDFLRAVIQPENGLATGKILSHLAIFEVPGLNRFLFKTDGGLNIAPDLDQKIKIKANAVDFLRAIGINRPRVAVLSTDPAGGERLPSAADAGKIKALAGSGGLQEAIVEGPIDMGIAVDYGEAVRQGLNGPVAGKADLFVVPNIEVGNAFGKAVIYFAGGKMAGLVLGAARPVILTSRGDSPFSKLSSISFACYYMMKYKSDPDKTRGDSYD